TVATILWDDKSVSRNMTEDKNEENADESERITEGSQPREAYLLCAAGDQDALYYEIDRISTIPMIPQFADYLIAELQARNILTRCLVRTVYEPFEAWQLTVPPRGREAWVAEKLRQGMQVMITNPGLVETGLDLNDFTTLIFYDIAFKLFTFRQASRRSWRINQTAPRVEVYILYYRDTMQERAVRLMASKLAVAGVIEGGVLTDEGLAAMSECEDMTSAL